MNAARKTLFWLIALVLVAGGYYFVEQRTEEKDRVVEENLKLFPFTVDAVDEFWITNPAEGVRVGVHRREGQWWLKKPITARGDQEKIESVLTNVVQARKDRTLFQEVDAAKLRELGLETPSLEMTFLTAGIETTIMFGGAGPTHNIAYAMFSGDPRVYRIHSDVKAEANKNAYDLRDKSLLAFDPVKLKRFEMDRIGQSRLVVEHHEGRWQLIEPARARASMENVLEGLFMIKDAEVKAFVDNESSEQGLDSPRIRVHIVDEQRTEPYILEVGAKDRVRRGYYARTNRSEDVLVIGEDLANYLLSVKDNWRESSP
ncbi:MAG: DUF4340 domain-containing protein [Halieaceae bacterium]|nr:DUF4340 domain-containing protein [Halieaceae bacterium]